MIVGIEEVGGNGEKEKQVDLGYVIEIELVIFIDEVDVG